MAIFTPEIKLLMPFPFKNSSEPISGKANKPKIMPAIVPIKPKYTGIGMVIFISSSTVSRLRWIISRNKLKSEIAPLLRIK